MVDEKSQNIFLPHHNFSEEKKMYFDYSLTPKTFMFIAGVAKYKFFLRRYPSEKLLCDQRLAKMHLFFTRKIMVGSKTFSDF